MQVTVHAAQRFLERVMSKTNYTYQDVCMALEFLEKTLRDVVVTSKVKYFVLPGFKNFRVVFRENTAITIIPKDQR
ncbi:MAG: hypothetical protein IE881_08345 [Epsilonproteobacteria bacterium]|nr:hypothetical protein [Campylobacterota bacterium]